MKNLFLIFLILTFACHTVQAKKIFVEMEFNKNCIKLDDGTQKKPKPITDENGNDLKFISLIGALNYMSLQGWELLETKSVVEGGGVAGTSATSTTIYYIFCKEVSDDELQDAVNNGYKE